MKLKLTTLFVFISFITYACAVKEYLFKNCDSSGFCKRNRAFANNVRATEIFQPQYSIDPESVFINEKLDGLVVNGNIIKDLTRKPGSQVIFPFEVSLLKENALRVKIDEKRLVEEVQIQTQRYNESSKWAFNDLPELENSSNLKYKLTQTALTIEYGNQKEYQATFNFKSPEITVSYNGEVQVVVNDQNFLNLEHHRYEDENEQHLSDQEIDFDMFRDSFKDSLDDKLPLGPESIALDFTLKGYRHVYGIPEHADVLDLKDTTDTNLPYRLYNVDIFEYETESRMPMYGSIPLLIGAKPEASVGIFWINAAETYVDVDKSSGKDTRTHWMSENGIVDFIIFIGKTPQDINKSYGSITGNTQLPQLFSLGYHQCRWNYNDEKDVLDINSKMDEHQIPYDSIWLDIEYAEAKKYFTWNFDKFPNPERMLKELDHTGRNLIIIIDPHMKEGYHVSDSLQEKGITMRNNKNETYSGHCWPGQSIWIDTTNPSSQAYWDELFRFTDDNEIFGRKSTNIHLWNDMNEPSVFNGPETTAPKDALHYDGWEHRSIHNLFGLTFHEATFNSLEKRLAETDRQRPFILTRSYFAGSQRTAAMWTGDNMAKWEYLEISLPMVLTSNIVNMPFAGADVGGFFGNPSKELLVRWYQTGIWYPFFRAHAHIDSRRREPWVPGEPYTSIIRDAVRIRYSLLPLIYTAFYEASLNGTPIMKPMFYENPENEMVYAISNQFYVGNSGLLVKPITKEGATSIDIYVPDNEIYYDFTNLEYSNNKYQLEVSANIQKDVSLNDIPILLKGGSIISKKDRYRRSSRLMYNDPYTIIIAPNSKNRADGILYVDDGESYNYKNGQFLEAHFNYSSRRISSKVTIPSNDYKSSIQNVYIEKIVILLDYCPSRIIITQDGNTWEANVKCSDGKLTIINPQIRINEDWEIELVVPENIADFEVDDHFQGTDLKKLLGDWLPSH